MPQDQLTRHLVAFPIVAVRSADARGDDLDEDFVWAWGEDRPLLDLEFPRSGPYDGSVRRWKGRVCHFAWVECVLLRYGE